MEAGGAERESSADRAPGMAEAVADSRHRRRLGGDAAPAFAPAVGRFSTPTLIIPIPTTRRSWSWRWTARSAAHAADGDTYREAIARGREWIVGMQSRNGGWGAFDADNTYEYLNQIPFSDHGALLDPPTADVTARCVSMLAQLGETAWRGRRARQGHRLSRTDAGKGRQLVRPLGHELHLRNLVGALRAECRRPRSASRRRTQSRRLARLRSRIPTAAGARMAKATGSTTKDMSPRRARRRKRRGH